MLCENKHHKHEQLFKFIFNLFLDIVLDLLTNAKYKLYPSLERQST